MNKTFTIKCKSKALMSWKYGNLYTAWYISKNLRRHKYWIWNVSSDIPNCELVSLSTNALKRFFHVFTRKELHDIKFNERVDNIL